MAINTDARFRPVKTIVYSGAAGQTRDSIPVTEVYQSLNLRLTGTYTQDPKIAGVANNSEGSISFLRNIALEGSSNNRRAAYGTFKNADFAAAFRLNQFLRGVAGAHVDPGAGALVAASVTPFSADLRLDFEMPHSGNPRLTYLNAARDLQTLTIVADWGNQSDLVTPGVGGVPVVTAQLIVSGRELIDPNAKMQKYGVNILSFQERVVTAAAASFDFDLRRGHLLRGFLIKTYTINPALGPYHIPADNIVGSVSFALNRETKSQYFDWATLQGQNQSDYRMAAPIVGYAFVDMMDDGNWNKIVNTALFRDVTLSFSTAAPAAPPVVTYVRVYPVEVNPS
jgi:hypothetical protein